MLQRINNFNTHFKLGLRYLKKTIPFIKKHQLWKGMEKYGWLMRLFVLGGIILGLKIFKLLVDFVLSIDIANPIAITNSVFHLFKDVSIEGYELFFLGGFKYVIVLALEVFIIHFGGKTTEILTGQPFHLSFKGFLSDQIRAVKVIFQKYLYELIATISIRIILNMTDLGIFESPLNFLVQCYFLGVVIMDNYFKHRGKTTRQSEQIIRQYAGLATAIGMCFYILLFLPIVGAIMGACITAVAGTLALHELKPLEQEIENSI